MKKTKRLLSLLTALTISASAFAGMVIPASADDNNTVKATLVHTASAQGGSNEAGTFLDTATHYYNNWASTGWIATAYSDFTFADGALPADKDKVVKAELTTYINCSRGSYPMTVGVFEAAEDIQLDLSGATAEECTIPILAKAPDKSVGAATVSTDLTAYTMDATNAVKDMIEAGESEIVFAYGGGAAGGTIAGKGDAEKQPTLVVTTLPDTAVKKTITVNYVDGDGNAVADAKTAQVYEGLEFTPEYEIAFTKDGFKYTYKSGGDKITVTDDATINIVYDKTEIKTSGVLFEETFDTYDAGEIIKSAGNDVTDAPAPVVKGGISYAAGRRNNGPMACTASIAEANSNKYLNIDSDGYATSGRGISFTFTAAAGIPAVDDIAANDSDILELSMEVEGTQPFELTGFGTIPAVAAASGTSGGAKAVITPTKSAESAVIIKAIYNKGVLKSMSTQPAENVAAGTPIEVNAAAGTTVMLWNSLDKMEPLAEPAEAEAVPTLSKSGMSVVRAIVDKANSKQYLIVQKPNGDVISSTASNLTATGFTGATFYNANADVKIDNIKVEKKASDVGTVNVSVKDADNAPVADTTINISGVEYTTDANGVLQLVLPNGSYKLEASKSGYEHTEGMQDNDIKEITVNSDTQEVNMVMSLMTYVKLPDNVEVKGGQVFIAAPKEEDTAATAAFTAEVKDQYEILMTEGTDYGLTWTVYPTGTTEADPNVTIDEDGVVTVSKNFSVEDKVKAYDVTVEAATADRGKKATVTLYVGNNDIIYYEPMNFEMAEGNRGQETNFKEAVTLPDMTSFTMNLTDITAPEKQRTVMLMSDAGALAGIQYNSVDKVIKVWSVWTGNSAYNQESDIDKFTNSEVLVENYEADPNALTITFVIDKTNKTVTASCGATTVSIPYTAEATKLTGIKTGLYRSNGKMVVKDITIQEPDENYLKVIGSEAFAKVSGKTITRTYTLGQSVIVDGEEFEWSVTAPDGATAGAVTIADGVLSVADTATAGTYKVKAVSKTNAEKTDELEVAIADFQSDADDIQVTLAGAQAINGTENTVTYSVKKVMDKFGDDITELLPAAVWTSTDTTVATIDSATGVLTPLKAGNTTVTATITNGTKTISKTVPVTISTYSITGTSANATVDTSALVKAENIKEYMVTTAKDGAKVKETKVAAAEMAASYTVDMTGADAYEIAPIFTYSGKPGELGVYGQGVDIAIPSDTYDFVVTANGERSDVYANDQIIVNNILQGGNAVKTVNVHDIVVSEGFAKLSTCEYTNGSSGDNVNLDISIVKSPSIVNRVPKVYVLGDSLVCDYYNGGSQENGKYQTGWGQVLQNYLKDVEVVNLANSGITAEGLLTSAITQVVTSGQTGDYMILESGYNDRTRSTQEIMKASVTSMVEQAEAKGINVVLTTPNACQHDYNSSVVWSGTMEEVATATETPFINLSKLSYEFLYGLYADDKDTVKATYNVSDGLHATYDGANKWASVIAKELSAMDDFKDIVNTEYKYTFTDTKGNTIDCQAK